MTVLRALLRFLRPSLWVLPLLVVLGVLASFAEGIGIGLLIPFLDLLMQGEPERLTGGPLVALTREYAARFDPEVQKALLGASIVALIAFKSVVQFLNGLVMSVVYGRVSHGLRTELFRRVTEADYAAFATASPARVAHVVKIQTWKATDALSYFLSMIIAACTTAVFAVLLLLISWQLALGVAAGLLLIQLVVAALARRAERLSVRGVAADHELAERLDEVFNGMRMVHAFGQEAKEQARFAQRSHTLRRIFQRSEFIMAAVSPLLELLHVPLFVGVLLLAWQTDVGLSTVLAFLLLLYRTQPHLKAVDADRVLLNNLAGAVLDVAEQLDRWGTVQARSGTQPFDRLRHGIAFHGIAFHYRQDNGRPAVLSDVSLEIPAGRTTAIVGRSGAGKSTLVNLLYRFHDPERGTITVDGRPLTALDRAQWRGRLAIAGQDTELVGGTIREAIAFGRTDATEAEVVEAARMANADGFIRALPAGYGTPVGSRGLRLSGGQRQRIALARALVRQPDILILDEATNALDGEAEAAVHEVLQRLAGRMTVIVIAHRLSAIRGADRVVVLDGGRVIEQGAPEDLMRGTGHFARLFCGG